MEVESTSILVLRNAYRRFYFFRCTLCRFHPEQEEQDRRCNGNSQPPCADRIRLNIHQVAEGVDCTDQDPGSY